MWRHSDTLGSAAGFSDQPVGVWLAPLDSKPGLVSVEAAYAPGTTRLGEIATELFTWTVLAVLLITGAMTPMTLTIAGCKNSPPQQCGGFFFT